MNPRDSQGRTPLMIACMTGNEAAVRSLVAQPEIDLDCRDDKGGHWRNPDPNKLIFDDFPGRTLKFYARDNKKIHLLLENGRRNPSEIQQLIKVKNVLNKEVQAEKDGRLEDQKEDVRNFNDNHEKGKHLHLDDVPDYLLEEAGINKAKKKKEKAVADIYTSERVQNYQGNLDVDTIVKNIEDTKTNGMTRKKNRASKMTDATRMNKSFGSEEILQRCDENEEKIQIISRSKIMNNKLTAWTDDGTEGEMKPKTSDIKDDAFKEAVIGKTKPKCDNTLCSKASMHRCSRCLAAAFCSKQCQVAAWPRHQLQCVPAPQHRPRPRSSRGTHGTARRNSLSEVD